MSVVVNVTVASEPATLDDDDAAFFSKRTSTARAVVTDELTQYLNSPATEIASIAAWPAIKRLFVQLKTTLPASAAAERMFSCAGLTKTAHRTALSDRLFEDLVLLKKNKPLFA